MDCQETDITQTDVHYGIFCPEPSLYKHCKVWLSLVSKDVFHWVFEFTLIVTPVGARKAIIVIVLTASTFTEVRSPTLTFHRYLANKSVVHHHGGLKTTPLSLVTALC